MTRSQPLTSLALGRSPYDDVVQGEGVSDPRLPPQAYDERGRPVNPEARRLNRELIRAHNEVMHAIGVAEPDDGAAERLAAEKQTQARAEADHLGETLQNLGGVCIFGGTSGILGLRNRILVYRRYSEIPFADLYRYERSRRSAFSLFCSGFPCFAVDFVIKHLSYANMDSPKRSILLDLVIMYIRAHLQEFVPMHRLELLPTDSWFPGLSFFIPFTATSPIPRPPPLRSFHPADILGWLGGVGMSFAPFITHQLLVRIQLLTGVFLGQVFFTILPKPLNTSAQDGHGLQSPYQSRVERAPEPAPVSSTARDHDIGLRRRPSEGVPRPESAVVGDSQAPHATIRRQSTFSSVPAAAAGDDYDSDGDDNDGGDDEGTERVFATLVQIDREPADLVSDGPPGVWSAELRPNAPTDGSVTAGEGGAPGDHKSPRYNSNLLTLFPARLAAETLASTVANIILAPLQAYTLRLMARSFWRRQPGGLAVLPDIYNLSPWSGLSRAGLANLVLLDMATFLVKSEVWFAMTLISQVLSEEDTDNRA